MYMVFGWILGMCACVCVCVCVCLWVCVCAREAGGGDVNCPDFVWVACRIWEAGRKYNLYMSSTRGC